MTTETDLRAALRARADDAPTFDTAHLLEAIGHDAPPLRSAAGASHGRRWAIAGVAAGFVALAAAAGVVVAGGAGPDTSAPAGPVASSSEAVTASDAGRAAAAQAAAQAAAARAAAASAAATASATSTWPVDPSDPTQPRPAAADWQDAQTSQLPEVGDDSAIVFTSPDNGDPITGSYVRDHQQLSVLSAGATAKDSSDAQWWTAVQVYLPGSGFDAASLGNPDTVTVNGVERKFVTLPRLLDAGAPTQIPSLLWAVGDDWVVLQIDTPMATLDQLVAAAARLDVHHG